jgi:hypothetical protein
MKTYIRPFPGYDLFIVPKLHKVKLSSLMSDHEIYEIRRWCKENCIDKFYTSLLKNSWEFEDDEDAMLFKLRWL